MLFHPQKMATSMTKLVQGLQHLSVVTCKSYKPLVKPCFLPCTRYETVRPLQVSAWGNNYLHSWSAVVVNKYLPETNRSFIKNSQNSVFIARRNKTYLSRNKCKPKTVKSVVNRFYRLRWGIWIRTGSGKHKKIVHRSADSIHRSRQYVFCNSTQSTLLDKMVTPYWLKPRHYPGDPYEPYHKRNNLKGHFHEVPKFLP